MSSAEEKVEACFGQLATDMHAVSLADLAREAIALLREFKHADHCHTPVMGTDGLPDYKHFADICWACSWETRRRALLDGEGK